MGTGRFFRFDRGRKEAHTDRIRESMVVDLGEFTIGSVELGSSIPPSHPILGSLTKGEIVQPPGQGLEIGSSQGVLDYGFFDLGEFGGVFTRSGAPLGLNRTTTEGDVRKGFGDPYWIDRSDGEVVLFYEYRGGTIELQFEFPDGKTLGAVTLALNGVLSNAHQREAHGVNKPWPPP